MGKNNDFYTVLPFAYLSSRIGINSENFSYNLAMAKKKRPARKYDKPLQTRVTSEQMELFREAADNDGRALSNWVRDRLEKAANRELKK